MSRMQQLLDIEVQQAFWEPSVAGLHLWPLIRHSAYQSALWSGLDDIFLTNALAYYHPNLWRTHLKVLPLFFNEPANAQYSILVFKSSATRNGHYDRLYEPYYQQFKNPLVFENWAYNDVRKPPHTEHYSDNMLRMIVAVLSKRHRITPTEQNMVRDFARHVVDCFDLPIEKIALYTNTMIKRLQRYQVMPELIGRFLVPRIQSRLALIHHAASMGYDSLMTRTLHDLGFTIAEVEHGTVHPLYADYQYSQQICDDSQHPSRMYLPDVFLTFGEFWSKSAHVPFKTFEIGYPHLTEKVAEIEAQTTVKAEQILIVSQSIFSTKSAEFADHLARAYPEKQIVIKLHPLYESPEMPHFQSLSKYRNVCVVQQQDTYQLIAESAVVVGFYSTVIYEILAFTNKRIFIQKNPRISEMIGSQFETPEELVEQINNPDTGYVDVELNEFWATDWQKKLKAFQTEYFIQQG